MSAWKPPRQAARSVAQLFTSRLTAKILPSDTIPPEASQRSRAASAHQIWPPVRVQPGLFAGVQQLSSTTENNLLHQGGKPAVPTGHAFSKKFRVRQTTRKILIDSNESYSVASRGECQAEASWAACTSSFAVNQSRSNPQLHRPG